MKYPAHFARVVLVFAVISLCSLSFPPGFNVWNMTHRKLAQSMLVVIALPLAPGALGVLFSLLVGDKRATSVFSKYR